MSASDAILLVLALVAGLFVVIQIVALIMGLALARSITSSIHELFTGTERVQHGDFTHRISISTKDQLGELADSFNQMTGSIENLLQTAAEKKRLEEELRIARQIQMSLLPRGGAGELPGPRDGPRRPHQGVRAQGAGEGDRVRQPRVLLGRDRPARCVRRGGRARARSRPWPARTRTRCVLHLVHDLRRPGPRPPRSPARPQAGKPASKPLREPMDLQQERPRPEHGQPEAIASSG